MNKDLNKTKEFDNSHNMNSSNGIKRALVEALVFILTLAIIAPIAISTVHGAFGMESSPYVVSGTSMDPTLTDGQMVMVNKNPEGPKNGDIIVFELPEKGYQFTTNTEIQFVVKRVLAGPGETIDIGSDDTITVNGVIVDEPYLTETAKNETYVPNYQSHYELGDDEYFVAGDNRGHSCDSRYFGVVNYSEITGTINQNTQSTTSMLLHILKYAIGIIVLYLLVEKILTVVLCKVFKV